MLPSDDREELELAELRLSCGKYREPCDMEELAPLDESRLAGGVATLLGIAAGCGLLEPRSYIHVRIQGIIIARSSCNPYNLNLE